MPSIYPGLYIGKVEQRIDPNRQGRLKVRIVGIHSDEIKVDHLPWAYPKLLAWPQGGDHNIPPLYSYTWVQFIKGHHEYPVWEGGWWKNAESSDGTGLSAHKMLPTSWFGGNPGSGMLQMDPEATNPNPQNQPNNFGFSSPNNKRYELDDRKNRERVVLGDQLDNFLYFNTEQGICTLEAGRGLRNGGDYFKQGLTLDSKKQVIQLYTFKGWKMTIASKDGVYEMSSPKGHKIRIENIENEGGSKSDNIQLWTNAGNRLILDEEKKFVVLRTASGRHLFLDDEEGKGGFGLRTKAGYMFIKDETGDGEIWVDGVMRVKSGGDMNFSAGGKLTIDGQQGVFLNKDAPDIPAAGPNYNIDAAPFEERTIAALPANATEIKRAPDYPYYADLDMP